MPRDGSATLAASAPVRIGPVIYRDQQPPLEYGPPRRYLACLVCAVRIEDGAEPVCSNACWVAVREHVAIDSVPDGLSRNEQLVWLVAAGRRLTWVSAWYGLSPGTVKNVARGVVRPVNRPRHRREGRAKGWLDTTPPSKKATRGIPKAAPVRKHIQCVVCNGPVNVPEDAAGTLRPLCSDRCIEALREKLSIEALPGGATRDEAIVALVTERKARREVAAWYGLSVSRINMIYQAEATARQDARSAAGNADQFRARGWLDRQ